MMITRLVLKTPGTPGWGILKSLSYQARFLSISSTLKSDTSEKKKGFLDKYMGPESSIASKNSKISRWSMFVPAFATHICLGAPYGWSAVSSSLAKEYGFVVSSSADWALDLCTYPMSMMIASGGICAALFGKWTMKVGTRRSMVTGGVLFGSAFGLTALGVSMHSLPLMYAGNSK